METSELEHWRRRMPHLGVWLMVLLEALHKDVRLSLRDEFHTTWLSSQNIQELINDFLADYKEKELMGSSSQRVAIMTSIQTYNLLSNRTILNKMEANAIGTPISNAGTYRTEVNTLLAGSIMITLSLLIMGLCFFLHRKLKSSAGTVSLHTLPWTDENLEVYTLSGQEEITGIYLPPTPSPPPAYETVVTFHKKEDAEILKKSGGGYNPIKKVIPEDDDLPSYETAIKLREQGYI